MRINPARVWYRVMNRRQRGGDGDDGDRLRFLGLMAELSDRLGLEVHVFV